eukprot:GHVN01056011.1.p1 GENE.GHVN01056011.1~~GHVN01056011.1.p1  ORF type:complete len:530 (+),score=72.30 GHVN01056011.1:71-1660(+)
MSSLTASVPTIANVKLCYFTQWVSPVVHYSAKARLRWGTDVDEWRGAPWSDAVMESGAKVGRREWATTQLPVDVSNVITQSTTINSKSVKDFEVEIYIELVLANAEKTEWDNPPPDSGHHNYILSYRIPLPTVTSTTLAGHKIPSPPSSSPSSPQSDTSTSQSLPLSPSTNPLPESSETDVAVFTIVDGRPTHVKGNRVVLVTDLDGTLVGHDDHLKEFNTYWLREHAWRGSVLVYSTGRNLKDMLTVAHDRDLLKPDYAVCGVGTEIYSFRPPRDDGSEHTHGKAPEWMRRSSGSKIDFSDYDASVLDQGTRWPVWCPSREWSHFDARWLDTMREQFNRTEVEETIKRNYPNFFVNGTRFHDPWRLSVSCEAVHLGLTPTQEARNVHPLVELTRRFDSFKILVSGAGDWRYLDILPASGGKLSPTLYVMSRLNRDLSEIMVAGDSGNDIDMFSHPEIKGCCVSNAQTDLVKFLSHKPDDDVNQSTPIGQQADVCLFKLRGLKPTNQVCFAPDECAGGILYALKYFGFD